MVAIAEHGKVGHRGPEHLLTNLLTCSGGHKMVSAVSTTSRGGSRYDFEIYRYNEKGCRVTVRREHANDLVRRCVRTRLTFEDVAVLAPSTRALRQAVDLRGSLGTLRKERADLEALLKDRALSAQGFRNAVTAIDLDIEHAEARLAEIEADNAFAAMLTERVTHDREEWSPDTSLEELTATYGSLNNSAAVGQRFDALPLHQRRAIVSKLFPRIEIRKVGRTGVKFSAEDRITLHIESGAPYVLSKETDEGQVPA